MKKNIFRDLYADEIEVRVQSVQKDGKGVQLLLYKDARCDMRILDETVGVENWQNKFYECKGNLYCSLGINIHYDKPENYAEWIWKDDCGSEGNMAKEKSEASDARKRAGFAWGIGRELYTSPFIWIDSGQCNIKQGQKGFECRDKFAVEKILIENKTITALSIVNLTTKKRCYVYNPGGNKK